jgi:hypothetical protein
MEERKSVVFSINTDMFGDMDGLRFFRIVKREEPKKKGKRRRANISRRRKK